jgi:hypothetical protein
MCRLHGVALDCCGQGSSSHSSGTRQLTLLNLPSEIHLSILSYADYFDLKALRKTNRYLRNMIELRQIRRALKLLERRPSQKHNSRQWTRLPCYDCLELLNSAQHFSLSMTTDDYRFCGPFSYNRRCMSCQHTGKSAFIGTKTEHYYFEEGCWIDCRLCRTTRSCQLGFVSKEATEHRQPICDVCNQHQLEIWPALAAPEVGSKPEANAKNMMSLFRRSNKTASRVTISEVTTVSTGSTKGFLRPTESFLNKAKKKIRCSMPTKTEGKDDAGTNKASSSIARVLYWRTRKHAKERGNASG